MKKELSGGASPLKSVGYIIRDSMWNKMLSQEMKWVADDWIVYGEIEVVVDRALPLHDIYAKVLDI